MKNFFYFSLILINIILLVVCFNKAGWDCKSNCAAVKVLENGNNPYLVDNMKAYTKGMKTGFLYLPISFILFKILCFFNRFLDPTLNYYIFWSASLIGTFLVVKKAEIKEGDHFLLITLLITGLMASWWNFFTGNIDLIHLFIISIIYFWIIRKKYYLASFFIVLNSLTKLTPLVFGGLFIFAKISKLTKFKILSLIIGLFILANLFSYLLFPGITRSCYLSLIGNLGQQYSPIYEEGGWANPALPFLIKDIANNFSNNNYVLFFGLYLIFISFILCFCINYIQRKKRDFVDIFSLGILAFMLILPRLKPYSFTWALLPIYFLIKDLNVKKKILFVLIVSVFPLIIVFWKASHIFFGISYKEFFDYVQIHSLFLFFIVFLVTDYFNISEKIQ
ncbi:glycosyltransferase family 87 protein [Candidatus Omnitrophota bacterium]